MVEGKIVCIKLKTGVFNVFHLFEFFFLQIRILLKYIAENFQEITKLTRDHHKYSFIIL